MKIKLNYAGVCFTFSHNRDVYRVNYDPLPKEQQDKKNQFKQHVEVTKNGDTIGTWTTYAFANKTNAARLVEKSIQ